MTAQQQPVPDAVLIERMMAGDENALSMAYDRYSGMLYGMLLRILKDAQAAEEVLQDLFLQLWRSADQFDANRGSLPAWLMVIGRNRAISRLRVRPTREILEESDGHYANTLAAADNIEGEAARHQLMERMRAAMAQLPQEQRQAIELAYFEEMTQSEIAARTGSPLGTVKTRVRTGMQSLKQLLN